MQIGWLKLVKGVTVAPKINTCNSRAIDFFVVSDGLRQAAPAAYTIGDGGFYPHSAVRLLLRGRARAAVVRQLKVPLGFGAVLPHGPPNKNELTKEEAGEQLGSDYAGLITKIDEELCIIEGRDGKEAKNSSGRKEGVAYCGKCYGRSRSGEQQDNVCFPGLAGIGEMAERPCQGQRQKDRIWRGVEASIL